MASLVDIYEGLIIPCDAELEKQAEILVKQGEEEDAAGRIMARGFADELIKLGAPPPQRVQARLDFGRKPPMPAKPRRTPPPGQPARRQQAKLQPIYGKTPGVKLPDTS